MTHERTKPKKRVPLLTSELADSFTLIPPTISGPNWAELDGMKVQLPPGCLTWVSYRTGRSIMYVQLPDGGIHLLMVALGQVRELAIPLPLRPLLFEKVRREVFSAVAK